MNIFVLGIIGITIITAIVFGIFFTGINGQEPMLQMVKPEHYTIEITGLKDTYLLGESFSFSYILSGFGSPCGGIHAVFPINKTTNGNDGFIPGCAKTIPTDFVLDAMKTYGRSYGNIALNEAGNYTVKISFEKPFDIGTRAEKSFTVINP
ncbi:MAG TPA: hypothetical protein VFN17_05345 [Nitrosarchaeum sp.]|nr:hypothetical protein [Nitrosarchaeum sp.]